MSLEQGELRREREDIYLTIDNKIACAKAVWECANSLPIISPEFGLNQEEIDRATFLPAMQALASFFPVESRRYARHVNTQDEIDAIQKQLYTNKELPSTEAKKCATRLQELKELKAQIPFDNTIEFIEEIDTGISNGIFRRRRSRAFLRDLGADYLNSEAYDRVPELRAYHGFIRDAVLGNFSINLIVDAKKFVQIRGENPGITIHGYHPSEPVRKWNVRYGPLWNIIRDDESPEECQRTIRHEDFHSFLDGFPLLSRESGRNGLYDFWQTQVESSIDRLKVYELINHEEGFYGYLMHLHFLFSEIIDYDYEEFLAEMAEGSERAIPKQSYATIYRKKKHGLLESQRGKHPEVDKLIIKTENFLNPTLLRLRIDGLLQRATRIEREEDLEMAFALFPLSQIRHIENLLRRWEAQSRAHPDI